ncbi:MAG: metal-dependent hydrolase [Rhodospirillaceae bacterium]|jgi:inner membrane protein|nr:metal-dependent hydrolase [Rhodospirillaceae bacterium]MBT4046199.1 metal-dependent hydrolase [Rhodospirillaceae bacterium]MBT4690622.1 metal-dependent hydrolase [Rhodospirillaceae bacterium]MBT5080582.1 metal-dependent hydrolase [Rhodospirillaceae bacterium]MBT5526549.1 metal-dependent hydrolase [Rhodospirillaceae bacterium]
MTTIMTHAAVGLTLGYALGPARRSGRYWLACALLPVIPDADVIGLPMGIAYGDLLGHRGLSHSLTFAIVLGLVTAFYVARLEKREGREMRHLAVLFVVLIASHGLMDMLTNGGLGIALFSPFITERFFWDWRPILVSPIGLKNFISPWGLAVVIQELRWFGAPAALLIAATLIYRYMARRPSGK